MKSEPSKTTGNRFHAPLRHYHRINSEKPTTWDEWIHGEEKNSKFSTKNLRKLLKIGAFLFVAIIIIAVAIGLFIELS